LDRALKKIVSLLRPLLWPLSLIYAAISLGLRRGRPQAVPGLKVISIGNLSMGGTGKTPLAIFVADFLRKRGRRVGILTRGYGGDEPLLFRKLLPGLDVAVGADRLAMAQELKSKGCNAAVMDDGFQRRHQLARDLDILVLDWSRREEDAYVLPAGRLREPLFCAAEADAVVVTHAPQDWNAEALRSGLPQAYQGLEVFRGDHVPLRLRALQGKASKPLSWLKGRGLTAVSGIGRPEAFESSLEALGAKVSSKRFADHHAYRRSDLKGIHGVLVCTAKDAVKLEALDVEGWVLEMELRVSPQKDFEALLK
jgi:tetraacyldisaccharide 4'-kinase